MEKVRLGIIGLGNIGKYHADYLQNKKVSRCELVAVCDAVAPLDRYQPLKTLRTASIDQIRRRGRRHHCNTAFQHDPGIAAGCRRARHGRETHFSTRPTPNV
jgi:homoserine dehydrogenase